MKVILYLLPSVIKYMPKQHIARIRIDECIDALHEATILALI